MGFWESWVLGALMVVGFVSALVLILVVIVVAEALYATARERYRWWRINRLFKRNS